MDELAETVGYCGLVCGVCIHRCQTDCRGGGGPKDCYQRKCCQDKGLNGCWECEEFPCDHGFFAKTPDPAWRGICIGSAQFIRERGLEEYVARVVARFGRAVDYEDYRYRSPQEIKDFLYGETKK